MGKLYFFKTPIKVDPSRRQNEIDPSLDSVTLINANSRECLSEDTSQTYHNVTDYYKTSSPHPQHLPEIESLSSETLLLQESDQTSKTVLIDKILSSQIDLSEQFDENLSSETLCLDDHRTGATNNNFSTTGDDSETLRDSTKSKRSDSKLFQKIKERYERNTTSPTETLGLKTPRKINEKHSSNIQSYPDVVLQSLTRFNISEKLPSLHGNDLEEPKHEEVRKEDDTMEKYITEEEEEVELTSAVQAPYYKDLKKSKLKNEIEKGPPVKKDELIERFEIDEKKMHNYENINNTEEFKSDDFSNIVVATPRKRKQKTTGNVTAKEKSELVKVKDPEGVGDQHIYEEITPCSTTRNEEKDEDTKAEVPSEHIYAELEEAKRPNKFLRDIRCSLFRLWAAVTPWAVARRVFWRGTQSTEERRSTELSRHSSRGKLNQKLRNITINN